MPLPFSGSAVGACFGSSAAMVTARHLVTLIQSWMRGMRQNRSFLVQGDSVLPSSPTVSSSTEGAPGSIQLVIGGLGRGGDISLRAGQGSDSMVLEGAFIFSQDPVNHLHLEAL